MLARGGADVSKAMADGYTPLHIAAEKNAREVAEVLGRYGVNVDQLDPVPPTLHSHMCLHFSLPHPLSPLVLFSSLSSFSCRRLSSTRSS